MKVVDVIIALVGIAISKFIPVQEKNILFTSMEGHYSDSPKEIAKIIHEIDPTISINWLLSEQYINSIHPKYRAIPINTLSAAIARGHAQIIIDNAYGGAAFEVTKKDIIHRIYYFLKKNLICKKKQKIYTTWHGTPLKQMGRDHIGNTVYDFVCGDITMILGNQYTLNIMRRLSFDKVKIKLLGCPRNDKLFLLDKQKSQNVTSLPEKKKIILYAPTFRSHSTSTKDLNLENSGIIQLQSFDIDALLNVLSNRFENEWVLVCRFHYFVSEKIDWKSLEKQYPGKIINGNQWDDMSDYLVCADVLLTDASSSMFDYMLTKRPCFLFFPDYEHYKNEERGLYYDMDMLPFPLSQSFEELLKNIESFDLKQYQREVEKLIDKFGYIDDANSSRRIAEYILRENNLMPSC